MQKTFSTERRGAFKGTARLALHIPLPLYPLHAGLTNTLQKKLEISSVYGFYLHAAAL